MQETELVMKLIRELSARNCNGHVRIKAGKALVDTEKFRNIFNQYARGTYFADVDLQIEAVDPLIACECGYDTATSDARLMNTSCPRCGELLELVAGGEFEILEPHANRENEQDTEPDVMVQEAQHVKEPR